MSSLVFIDGSIGGGQVLRSALSLSAVTGRPFVIEDIRKGRRRSGLMRQHLTAVQAAAALCGAEVEHAELGATRLSFRPGPVQPGHYHLSIASAGSACLVLQTVLPPLMLADAPSSLVIDGGTHNPLAPPYPFLDTVFFPLVERMGVGVARTLSRAGFYPAGGGKIEAHITPAASLRPFEMLTRGALTELSAEALVTNIAHHVAERELSVVGKRLDIAPALRALRTPEATGPGNVVLVRARHEHATELTSAFGEPSVSAERVAHRACDEMQRYLAADVPVGEHLSDQLLIPMALAGSGAFRTLTLTDHARTNMEVISAFLPVAFDVRKETDQTCLVTVRSVEPRTA